MRAAFICEAPPDKWLGRRLFFREFAVALREGQANVAIRFAGKLLDGILHLRAVGGGHGFSDAVTSQDHRTLASNAASE